MRLDRGGGRGRARRTVEHVRSPRAQDVLARSGDRAHAFRSNVECRVSGARLRCDKAPRARKGDDDANVLPCGGTRDRHRGSRLFRTRSRSALSRPAGRVERRHLCGDRRRGEPRRVAEAVRPRRPERGRAIGDGHSDPESAPFAHGHADADPGSDAHAFARPDFHPDADSGTDTVADPSAHGHADADPDSHAHDGPRARSLHGRSVRRWRMQRRLHAGRNFVQRRGVLPRAREVCRRSLRPDERHSSLLLGLVRLHRRRVRRGCEDLHVHPATGRNVVRRRTLLPYRFDVLGGRL